MKQLQFILLSVCIVSSIHFYVYQQADSQPDASIESLPQTNSDSQQAAFIPFFTTTDDHEPTGQYWPTSSTIFHDPDGQIINTASADINDTTYNDVIQSNSLLSDEKSRYIGYFIDATTHNKMYVYGTKYKIVPDDDNTGNSIIIGGTDDDDDN